MMALVETMARRSIESTPDRVWTVGLQIRREGETKKQGNDANSEEHEPRRRRLSALR